MNRPSTTPLLVAVAAAGVVLSSGCSDEPPPTEQPTTTTTGGGQGGSTTTSTGGGFGGQGGQGGTGNPDLIVLDDDASGPRGLVVDEEAAYWVAYPVGKIRHRPLDRVEPAATFAEREFLAMGLARHDGQLYWSQYDHSGGHVYSVDLATRAVVTVATDALHPAGVAADDSGVYWTAYGYFGNDPEAPGALRRWTAAGGVETLVHPTGGFVAPTVHLALSDDHVYWSNKLDAGQTPAGGVYRVDKLSGVNELWHEAANVHYVTNDSQHVYFNGDDPCGLWRKALSASPTDPAEQIVDEQDACPGAIALDDTHVFWTSQNPAGAGMHINRADKDGSARRLLFVQPTMLWFHASFMAQNSSHVFWTWGTDEWGVVQGIAKDALAPLLDHRAGGVFGEEH